LQALTFLTVVVRCGFFVFSGIGYIRPTGQ
jgi:hypothetical protein